MPLSALQATLVCIGFTFIYIAGFYLFKIPGSRNDPNVVVARMKAVTIASLISWLIVGCIASALDTKESTAQLLGLQLHRPLETVNYLRPLLLTITLFLGPLSIMFLDQLLPFQRYYNFNRDVEYLSSIYGQRDYIVAPLTEEFVFRACMIAILFQANFSRNYLIFVSPFYFGFAHLHHAWNSYKDLGRNAKALKIALMSSLFQFIYTTIFGWYTSCLFIRMGSIWPPVLCHSFCNIMGFPDLNDVGHRSKIQRLVIYSCFPLGIFLFIYNFDRLTDPSHVGGSMYWR